MRFLSQHLGAVVLLIFAASGTPAFAQMRERYVLRDGGRERAFVVARDELAVTNAVGKRRRELLGGAADAEAVRRAAEDFTRRFGEVAAPVLYEEGVPRTTYSRRLLTGKIAVQLAPRAAVPAVAAGVLNRGAFSPGSRWFIFEAVRATEALEAAEKLRVQPGVVAAEPLLARLRRKRLLPNDSLFSQQWHLRNTGQSGGVLGLDVKVTGVWDNWKGHGIRIGIIDDGVQLSHPDLVANLDTIHDHNWNDGSPDDPSASVANQDFHGNACAGVAAARGNNAIGVSGAAPEATIVGLRLIAQEETDVEEAAAMLWENGIIQIKSNSWGPDDDGRTLEAPGPLLAEALADATTNGRGGLGTIICWAGGNGRESGDNSNYDGFANSIHTLAVGAITNDSQVASYSEDGANLAVVAPSSGGTLDITTTDLTSSNGFNTSAGTAGNYADDFGGTSSACPLAAGCVALLLQSKPMLGYRDVKEILMRSATQVNPGDSDWATNAAGLHFNHKFGAGLLNAQAAVALAATWTNLPPLQNVVAAQTGLGASIPDNHAAGLTRTFTVGQNLRAEHVTMQVNIEHTSRGQLEITLTSPAGTVSRLAEKRGDSGDHYAGWTFMTVRNWGENSAGTWTLRIADRTATTVGTLTAATLTIFGSTANQPPAISAATISPSGGAFFDETLRVTSVTASDVENDPITFSYRWQHAVDGLAFADLAGATNDSLALAPALSGQLVRCVISATSGGQTGLPFFTTPVSVNRRPRQFASHGSPYSYDSDLFLAAGGSFTRRVLINEFSQGPSQTKEWIELLVTQTADLRGCTLGDKAGDYFTFSNAALWSALPSGTLIVLYNAADRDPLLPADDFDAADGRLIIPHTAPALFTTQTWNGLSNNNPESIRLLDAEGALLDGLSINGDPTQTPSIAAVGSTNSAHFAGGSDEAAESSANWTIAPASQGTPGAGNGGANSQLIAALAPASFRFGASGDAVPGLSIDPATGVISGAPDVPSGGFFNIIIERFTPSQTVAQTVALLVADATGHVTIPAGRSWTLNAETTLPGHLTVLGTLDTAGHTLTVTGQLNTTGGTVLNSNGTLAWRRRDGPLPPGRHALISDPANDTADNDGDGIRNLLEFLLGTNPSAASQDGVPQVVRDAGRLQLSFATPVGATGVTAIVEVSSDLLTWHTGTGFTQTVSDVTAGDLRTATVRSTTAGAPLFIRLRAARTSQ